MDLVGVDVEGGLLLCGGLLGGVGVGGYCLGVLYWVLPLLGPPLGEDL